MYYNPILYTRSYKYRTAKQFEVKLVDCPPVFYPQGENRLRMPFAYIVERTDSPYLVLEQFFGWDGATWAIDTPNFRRGSACHDALLEMIGLGLLPADPWKKWSDNFLIKLCEEDGMWWPRRKWVYRAVRRLGDPKGSKPREVLIAP